MATIPHTIRRNETYSFNYRLTDKIYRKSLKTDSPSLCRFYVTDILYFIRKAKYLGRNVNKCDIDQFIEMLISNHVNNAVRTAKAITEPLSTTSKSLFNQWYRETDNQRYNQYNYDNLPADVPNPRPEYPAYSKWLSEKVTCNYDHLAHALSEHNPATGQYEVDLDHQYISYFQYPTLEKERYRYISSIIDNHAEKIATANNDDNLILAKMHLDSLTHKFNKLLPKQPPPIVNGRLGSRKESVNNESIMLDDLEDDIKNYFRASKQASSRYIANRNAPFKDFIVAFKGMPLNTITANIIEEVWLTICRIPKLELKYAKKYNFEVDKKGKSTDEVHLERREKRWSFILENDEDELPELIIKELYSEGQLKIYKTVLENIFIVAKRKKYIEVNPFVEDDINLIIPKDRSNTRTKLPADKAKAIVNHCLDNLEHSFSWAILLMAFQGMRNEEVTSLTNTQMITDSETNIVYIHVLKGKTKNAKRKIPVHSTLIRNGFLEFVDNKTDSPIFDFDSNQLTRHFNYFRQKFDIPLCDIDGNLLSLYSFRHNVISFLGSVSEEYKYRLIGHGRHTVTANYTSMELIESQRLINLVSY